MYREWPSFDELKRWADQSPDRLEAFRKRETEALIARAPENIRSRLRGLQFQVNSQRKLHKSPMGSCVTVSKMMHDSLHRLQEALSGNTQSQKIKRYDNVVSLF